MSHYLFFSDEWEMGMQWHVTIAPHDWARIYLRRRFTEASPSASFEIPSLSDPASEPQEIQPHEAVFR